MAVVRTIHQVGAANPWINMGVKDDFAFDQPSVSFELFENDGSGTSLGPDGDGFFGLTNQFLLDTGATSMIAMNDAESELQANGYVTENTVFEQGVAGYSELDVSAPYIVQITDSSGAAVSLPNSRIMSAQLPDLFGINGLIGMPGMVGRVVSLDETVWDGIATLDDLLDADPLRVTFAKRSFPLPMVIATACRSGPSGSTSLAIHRFPLPRRFRCWI